MRRTLIGVAVVAGVLGHQACRKEGEYDTNTQGGSASVRELNSTKAMSKATATPSPTPGVGELAYAAPPGEIESIQREEGSALKSRPPQAPTGPRASDSTARLAERRRRALESLDGGGGFYETAPRHRGRRSGAGRAHRASSSRRAQRSHRLHRRRSSHRNRVEHTRR